MKCWNCQADARGGPLCPSCEKIAPRVPGTTHFEFMGLPARHALDRDALEAKYRELSLKLHPDRYAQADARERRMSLEQSAALNEAFKTLRDPVKRAFYLLKLHGLDLDREDQGHLRGMPPEFLEEVLELREALAEASLEQAQRMAAEVEKKKAAALKDALEALERLPEPGKGAAGDASAEVQSPELKKATHALARVRYFDRFLEQVAAMEEEAL